SKRPNCIELGACRNEHKWPDLVVPTPGVMVAWDLAEAFPTFVKCPLGSQPISVMGAAGNGAGTPRSKTLVATKFKLWSRLLTCRPLTQGAFSKLPCLSRGERVAAGRVRGQLLQETRPLAVKGC